MRTGWTVLVLFVVVAAGATARANDRILIEGEPDALRLDVDAPVRDAIERLREHAGLDLVVQGALPSRVRLRLEGVDAQQALEQIAASAGLRLERYPGAAGSGSRCLYVVSAPARRRSPPVERVPGAAGLWRMPRAFDHLVRVLGDDEADVPARAFVARLEANTLTALVVSPATRSAALADYARNREHYREILRHAGLELPLPRSLDPRAVRVYLDRSSGLYLVEALFAAGPRHVGRLVWTVRARDARVVQLTIGRWAVREGGGDTPGPPGR